MIFLRMRHWLIFLLVIALPYSYNLVFVYIAYQYIGEAAYTIATIVDITSFIALHSWIYNIITGLHDAIPKQLRPILAFYYVSIIFIVIQYILSVIIPWATGIDSLPYANFLPLSFILKYMLLIYNMCFAAYTLVMAERKREFPLIDMAAEAFAFLFFVFGIWWLQPRVNALVEKDEEEPMMNIGGPIDQGLRS